jgi:hypothetical protein
MASRPTTEVNPFQIRKADDLEEAQIQKLFVEPNPEFLNSLLAERTHRVLQGGRGAGKTITLRKLGAALSAPGPTFPFLGVYLSLDVRIRKSISFTTEVSCGDGSCSSIRREICWASD